MRSLLAVMAAAVTLLVGCTNPPDEAKTTNAAASTPPPVTRTVAVAAPPPTPLVSLTVATDACTDKWRADWAKEHHSTIAAAERHARTLPVGSMVNGKPLARNGTVWAMCEGDIVASRAALAVAAPAPAAAVAVPTLAQYNTLVRTHEQLKLQYATLRGEAYKNPLEQDPAKLESFRAENTDLQRKLGEKEWPIVMFSIIAGLSLLLGGLIGVLIGWLWRSRQRKSKSFMGSPG